MQNAILQKYEKMQKAILQILAKIVHEARKTCENPKTYIAQKRR